MRIEARLYDKLGESKVKCVLCQRRCTIPDGSAGFCMTRENRKGTLYSTIYGEVSSLSINPIEKKPVYHIYPGSRWLSAGSVGCNFRCSGCQNWHFRNETNSPEIRNAEELVSSIDERTSCICYFGGDPTPQLPFAIKASRLALERNVGRILRICWETNGTMNPRLLDQMLDLSLKSEDASSSTSRPGTITCTDP